MRRVLRLLAVWLLAVSVPLQGFAAASMTGCGPDHRAVHNALGQRHDPGASPHADAAMPHDHAAMVMQAEAPYDSAHAPVSGPAHAHADRAPATASAGTAVGTSTVAKAASSRKCSLCASCCTTALPASSLAKLDAVVPTEFFAPPPSSGAAVFLTSGQERPPRPLLA